MSSLNPSPQVSIKEFVGSKQANLFQTLKYPQFTGELELTSTKGEKWTFYFYLGRIIYADGGVHSTRRWMRNVRNLAPGLINQISEVNSEVLAQPKFKKCWEYELLSYWLDENIVNRQHFSRIIHNIVVEILFDITQRMEVVFELSNDLSLSTPLVFINPDQVIYDADEIWSKWKDASLADRFPNDCPTIVSADKLQKQVSDVTAQRMLKIFNGKNTLRDLSLILKQDIIDLTRSILPYVQLGLVDLIAVKDLRCPLNLPSSRRRRH